MNIFLPLILVMVSCGIIVLVSIERKKQKKEYEVLIEKMKSDSSLLSKELEIAQNMLKQTNRLSYFVKKEEEKLRNTNRFLKQAIKEKVNKKKIRGKRRRKTA